MDAYHDILTAEQVAEICRVSVASVECWCESGSLKSHCIPRTKIRQIRRSRLEEWLSIHGMQIVDGHAA